MKKILSKIYSIAKVLAVVFVLIAALGVIYEQFSDGDIIPLESNVLTEAATKGIDGGIVATNSDSYDYPDNYTETTNNSDYLSDKITYNSTISLTSYDFDNSINKANEIINKYSMVILDDDYKIYRSERSDRFYLKVRSSDLDNAIEEFKQLGNVTLFNKNAMNVSEQYIDLESRVQSLESQLERYNSLLNDSNSTSDLSNIYSQIDYLETQLEYAKRSLKGMDDDIKYSTITLTIVDIHKYREDGTIINTDSFVDNFIYSLGDSWIVFVNFILGAIIMLVYIIPFAILIALIYFVIKRSKRALEKRRAEDNIVVSEKIEENDE